MANLDATLSGTGANSYLTVDEADDLMDGYLQIERWEDLDADDKALLLRVGTRRIDQYSTWGEPAVQGQALAFPRKVDGPTGTTVRKEVKRALMAFVDFMLEDELVGLKKLQGEGVTSASLLGQSSSFEKDPSGLPAEARRELDQLVASYPPLTMNREYDGSSDSNAIFG